ncbi:junctional cadherin 5-associated protein [Hippopotamus amphibius kiboko]|uniref:junctional cadherin 5-associated protein n=1 Tax=Hippopotamus amphibius kiboko TaxID=575201 RepID=UPI00259264EE|nr:junctional cadherin 5-associated protein [Hippopotamus amphibius kiboko]XP_057589456.1 junctional cadherin 5-associated protein [Hippopotamus amphibius kiboko]XP_057589457.1 junctional cadherin 5-associated protein [Hippopotamus amphibius kiboko]
MYSVEDLLISHGYKLSRNPPAAREDDGKGRQPTRTRAPAGPGLLNGYDDGPAAFPRGTASLGTDRLSDPESRLGGLRGRGEPLRPAAAARISETGFYHQPVLAGSSQPLTGRSHAYWRRREPEARKDPAQAPSAPARMTEGPWEVGGRTENVMKKAVWEEELGMAGPARWQSVRVGSWKQPRKLGRQMSDGVGEKLFQDLYPFVLGEHGLTSQSKGKSQSLPRVLSPGSLSCVEVPIPLSDGHVPGVPKVPFQPPNCAPDSESARSAEKGGSLAPLPRPRFGRPLKPPSYGSHQHSRAGVENGNYVDSRQPDPGAGYSAKTNDTRQELCGPDPGLEPPVYVPPPSYRSPPQPTAHACPAEAVPGHEGGGHRAQQHLMEKPAASCQAPSGSRGARNERRASPCSPVGVPPQPHPTTAYDRSIVYIPFNDPRIRHLKLARPHGFWEDVKLDGPVPAPEPAQGSLQREGAVRGPAGRERAPTPADPSPPWLWGHLPRAGEDGGFLDQRDPCVVTRGQRPDVSSGPRGYTESLVSSPSPQGESTCETQTQLRKFKTGLQTKKSSKKKTSETIFCLVSIPVKSESHLPDTDTNNNDLKQSADERPRPGRSAALQEQSLLSLSSTDLELQALTGSLAGRTGPQKTDPGDTRGDQLADDLGFPHPAKHGALTCPGSWPGHQYRDQQTQTSFIRESQSPQSFPGEKQGASPDALLLPQRCLEPAPFEVQMHMAFASTDQNQRPRAHSPKGPGPLSPSSSGVFSRSSSSRDQAPAPRAGPGPPCADGRGHQASPVPRGEVVKGETTGPCNSRQLFGQFLLKPVSRRPWDLISQLESFNKELQEEEGSSDGSSSGSEDSEAEPSWGGHARPAPEHPSLVEGRAPEDPGPRPGRVKSKSESWSEEGRPRSPRPWQAEDARGATWLSPPGSWVAGDGDREVEDGLPELAVSPRPVKRVTSSGSSDAKEVPSPDSAEPRAPPPRQELPSGLRALQLSAGSAPTAGSGEQRRTGVPLSLAGKPRGLSAPDLRSVGLTLAPEQSASMLAGSPAEASAVEIPPNESLEARAARILGIEVAVESLLPGARRTGHSQHPEPEGGAHRPESPPQEAAASPAQPDDPIASTDAFYGRRKCGWTKSPLFVGERDSTRQAPRASEPSGVDGVASSKASEPQPSPQECQPFHLKDVGTKPPFRSTLFHFVERTSSLAASEKRLRSTSKVIESLQEKLASPPRRADPGRLMRMKEVSSVSRLRLLTSRGTDSAEEAEVPKGERGPRAQPGGLGALSDGHKLFDPSSTLLLEEDRRPTARREENGGQDFWCPDSYDPSRVERV